MGSAPDAYIAYFQSYTNTYAPLPYLETLFSAAICHPKVVALSIGTRRTACRMRCWICVPA